MHLKWIWAGWSAQHSALVFLQAEITQLCRLYVMEKRSSRSSISSDRKKNPWILSLNHWHVVWSMNGILVQQAAFTGICYCWRCFAAAASSRKGNKDCQQLFNFLSILNSLDFHSCKLFIACVRALLKFAECTVQFPLERWILFAWNLIMCFHLYKLLSCARYLLKLILFYFLLSASVDSISWQY